MRSDPRMYALPFPDDAHVRAIGWNGRENKLPPRRADGGANIVMKHTDIRG